MRVVDSAKVIRVIKTKSTRGNGTSANPSRVITQYWSLAGELLFEEDPIKSGKTADFNEGLEKTGYIVKSPKCGRDENGVFHCECGKCEPLIT